MVDHRYVGVVYIFCRGRMRCFAVPGKVFQPGRILLESNVCTMGRLRIRGYSYEAEMDYFNLGILFHFHKSPLRSIDIPLIH